MKEIDEEVQINMMQCDDMEYPDLLSKIIYSRSETKMM